MLVLLLWLFIFQELQMRHQAMEAFKETMAMFKESVKIVEKNERLVPHSELRKLVCFCYHKGPRIAMRC